MFGSFGNQVKIKSTEETIEKGFCGKVGEIYGETTPSITGVDVIGQSQKDYAINVWFKDLDNSYWFDENLIEMIDNGEGTEITLDGVNSKFTKKSNGEWIEESSEPQIQKKWWKFWS